MSFTPFFSSLYLPLLLLHAETIQTHNKSLHPQKKKTTKTTKNHCFVGSSRQASCFCEKHEIGALLENLVDHDRVYLCSLGPNIISHSFLDNPLFLPYPLFFRHCQVWWLLPGIMVQPSNPSLQKPSTLTIHQGPKCLPVKLSTSGQKHFWMAVRTATESWSGPHNS